MTLMRDSLAYKLVEKAFPDVALGDEHDLRDGTTLVWEDGGDTFYLVEGVSDREGAVEVFTKKTASYVELPCKACDNRGFLVSDIDSTGKLAIERCDACVKFNTDNDAIKYVMDRAGFLRVIA